MHPFINIQNELAVTDEKGEVSNTIYLCKSKKDAEYLAKSLNSIFESLFKADNLFQRGYEKGLKEGSLGLEERLEEEKKAIINSIINHLKQQAD